MHSQAVQAHRASGYVLRFQSLFYEGRALAFECDAGGRVDLDAMSARARLNYLYARSVIGRDFATPFIERTVH